MFAYVIESVTHKGSFLVGIRDTIGKSVARAEELYLQDVDSPGFLGVRIDYVSDDRTYPVFNHMVGREARFGCAIGAGRILGQDGKETCPTVEIGTRTSPCRVVPTGDDGHFAVVD